MYRAQTQQAAEEGFIGTFIQRLSKNIARIANAVQVIEVASVIDGRSSHTLAVGL